MILYSLVALERAAEQALPLPLPVSNPSHVSDLSDDYRLRTVWLDEQSPDGCDVLACLTLYNEPAEGLATTLTSLIDNQRSLTRPTHEPIRLEVAIVLDGRDRIHPETEALLHHLGFDLDRGLDVEHTDRQGLPLCRLLVQTRAVMISQLHPALQYGGMDTEHESLCVHLAVKTRNQGKLDSHAFFFWSLVEHLKPHFVLQIDAGSRAAPDCLALLMDKMAQEPQCAALATNIVMEGAALSNWLQSWQQADFIWQKLSEWPIGNGLGYLEVVPGQASLFRMSALKRGDGGDPLAAYLRGVSGAKGLMEANLFLAEDRIIGAEILKSHRDCTIRYHHNAHLVTDGCALVGELLRQRRRWTNSTLVARLSTISSLADVVCNGGVPPARRWSLCLGLMWSFMQLLLQWFIPAALALLVSLAAGLLDGLDTQVDTHTVEHRLWAPMMVAGVMLFWLYCLLSMQARENGRPLVAWLHTLLHCLGVAVLFGCTVVGFVLCLIRIDPVLQLGVIMVGLLLLLAVWCHSHQKWSDMVRVFWLYIPAAPVANFYLLTYALANFHDVSWGTKGLVATVKKEIPSSWRWKQWQLLTGWFVSNAIVVGLVVGLVPGGAITVLQWACLPVIGQITTACSLLLWSKCQRPEPVLPVAEQQKATLAYASVG
ncbi:glycosyltransferase [Rhizobium sp.]|uniref:glycosyltransferase n=1 Tax=Rhizobium sp. TaxID=391 RepID=UPI002AA95464